MKLIEQARRYKDGIIVLKDWLFGGANVVEQELAQKRADVCLNCPMNKSGLEIVAAVSLEIKRQLELKKHLKFRVRGERRLHTCAACLCPMRLKVWVPLEYLSPDDEERAKLHQDCWLRKESL